MTPFAHTGRRISLFVCEDVSEKCWKMLKLALFYISKISLAVSGMLVVFDLALKSPL